MDETFSIFAYRDLLFATSDGGCSLYAEAETETGGLYWKLLRTFHHLPDPNVFRKLMNEWVENRCYDARGVREGNCSQCGGPERGHPLLRANAAISVARLCTGVLVRL